MTPEQKKAIDQQTAGYLSDNYKDRIVIYVAYGSNVRTDDANLAIYWQKQSTDMMKNSVFLINQRGERIPIINFAVNGGAAREFQFDFPRELNGKPVILPDDKTVKLEFVHPDIGMPTQRVLVNFNPSKMIISGSSVY